MTLGQSTGVITKLFSAKTDRMRERFPCLKKLQEPPVVGYYVYDDKEKSNDNTGARNTGGSGNAKRANPQILLHRKSNT